MIYPVVLVTKLVSSMDGEIEARNSVPRTTSSPAPKNDDSVARIDMDVLMTKFQRQLGRHWEKYRDTLSHYLMGKLSRAELVTSLNACLGSGNVRNHNFFVLSLLANAFREPPPGNESSVLGGWSASKSGSSQSNQTYSDTSAEMIFREILSLPVRERTRIKNISRERQSIIQPPRQGGSPQIQTQIPPPLPVVTATRQTLLPRIPFVQDRDKSSSQAHDLDKKTNTPLPLAQQQKSNISKFKGPQTQQLPPDASTREEDPTVADLPGVHPGRPSGPLTWTQDIIHAFELPLASESYELPTDDTVGTRMLGIALENGLVDGLEAGTTDMMLVGLEQYLRRTMERLIETSYHRNVNSQHPLGPEDLDLFVDVHPSELVELSAPYYRLKTNFLQDEETAPPAKKPRVSAPPELDLLDHPPTEPLPEHAAAAEKENEAGKGLISGLLQDIS